jgi:calcineurin-like phosphoesterase family protein
MTVWFVSDPHFGSQSAAKFREFDSVDEHDALIVENINRKVGKRAKLFILGDLAFNQKGLERVGDLRCQNIELIIGNHDKFSTRRYLTYCHKVHGFRKYRDYWLSHCPVHPNELYRVRGNIHGHVHATGNSKPITDPRYFCANVDMNNYQPIPFEHIQQVCGTEIWEE